MKKSLIFNLEGLLVVIVLSVTCFVGHKKLRIIAGAGLFLLLLISLVKNQGNRELTAVQKRLFWIVLIPLFSILKHLNELLSIE